MRTPMIAAAVALLTLVASLAMMGPAMGVAQADTVITVTTTADTLNPNDGLVSLREATLLADLAGHDDTIVLGPGLTYALTFCGPVEGRTVKGALLLRLADGVTIEGNGSTITQSCTQSVGLRSDAFVSAGPSLTVRHTTIRTAESGFAVELGTTIGHIPELELDHATIEGAQGACIDMGTMELPFVVTLRSSHLVGCTGRGITSSTFIGSIALSDSEITGVTSVAGGEALALSGYDAVITGTSIHHNEGGVALGRTTISGSHFDHNRGPSAVFVAVDLGATDSTFDDNVTEAAGASRWAGLRAVGIVEVTRVSVSGNRGPSAGLQLVGAGLPLPTTVTDSRVEGNVADVAGDGRHIAGVFAGPGPQGTISIAGTTVRGNVASDNAGLYAVLDTTIRDSTFALNTVTGVAQADWRASVAVRDHRLTMSGSTVHGNTVSFSPIEASVGGVLAMDAHLTNDTITGNEGVYGGVVTKDGELSHVTLADNIGAGANDLLVLGAARLSASIVSSPPGSSGRACRADNQSGTVVSGGSNFVSDGSCPLGGGPAAVGDVTNGGDAQLAPLTSAGTVTESRAPLPGSPVRDRIPVSSASQCSGLDQRAVVRPQGLGCDIGAVEAKGSRFHGLNPTRLLDSRVPGTPGFDGRLQQGAPRWLTVTKGDVPRSAAAVVLNVTVTGSSANSFLNVWPAGEGAPNASSVNFAAGQTIPNLVTVPVGVDGQVAFATNQGSTDVVVDVMGWFDDGNGAGDGWVGIDPTRIVDTRTTGPGSLGKVKAGTPRPVAVGGPAIPADASALVLNVTVTEGTAGSFLTVWPQGRTQPTASNLNFAAGETTANAVVVQRVGADGAIDLANAVGEVHVIVDVVGYFTPVAGSRFFPRAPTRVLDDRTGTGASGPWHPGETRSVPFTSGLSANVTGAAANVTVTNGTSGSFLTVFPHGAPKPTASTINFGPGQTIANHTMVRVVDEQVDIANHLGSVDVLADVVGYYCSDPPTPDPRPLTSDL